MNDIKIYVFTKDACGWLGHYHQFRDPGFKTTRRFHGGHKLSLFRGGSHEDQNLLRFWWLKVSCLSVLL